MDQVNREGSERKNKHRGNILIELETELQRSDNSRPGSWLKFGCSKEK